MSSVLSPCRPLVKRLSCHSEYRPTSITYQREYEYVIIHSLLLKRKQITHCLSVYSKLVVELTDVRIIALGVLNKPRGPTSINTNARLFLHPPGIEREAPRVAPAAVSADITAEEAVGGHDRAPMIISECYCSPAGCEFK